MDQRKNRTGNATPDKLLDGSQMREAGAFVGERRLATAMVATFE